MITNDFQNIEEKYEQDCDVTLICVDVLLVLLCIYI